MPGTCCSSHGATLSCDSVATSRDPGHDTLLQCPGTWDWVSSSRLHTCGLHSTHAAAHTCAHAHTHASHTSGRRRRRRAWAPGGGVGPVSTAPGLCGQPLVPRAPQARRSLPAPDRPCTPQTLSHAHPSRLLPASQNRWFSGPPLQPHPPRVMPIVGTLASKLSCFPLSLLPVQLPPVGGNGTQQVSVKAGEW